MALIGQVLWCFAYHAPTSWSWISEPPVSASGIDQASNAFWGRRQPSDMASKWAASARSLAIARGAVPLGITLAQPLHQILTTHHAGYVLEAHPNPFLPPIDQQAQLVSMLVHAEGEQRDLVLGRALVRVGAQVSLLIQECSSLPDKLIGGEKHGKACRD